jgi:PAS domain S-box-containing protein
MHHPDPLSYNLDTNSENTANDRELPANGGLIKKITNLAPSIITVYDVHSGKYIFMNEAVQSLLGYDRDEVLKKGMDFFLLLIHPDDLSELVKKNDKALEKANSMTDVKHEDIIINFRHRLLHANGEYRWFRTYGTVFSRDADHRVKEVINISFDIDDEVNTAVELQQKNAEMIKNEQRFHKMTELVEDYAILMLDREGYIQNWNKGAEKIKGYKAEEILGKHFRIFYTAEDQKDRLPEKLIDKAMREGKATHEGWRARKNGENFWGYIVITTLYDESNNVFGFSKVTRDLTEKRQAEQMLQQLAENLQKKNQELEQSNKELESFSYAASHDLQEPLRKIKTFSHFILDNDKDKFSGTTGDYFQRIISAADRMQHLIEALMSFSRIGATTPVLEEINLGEAFEEAKKDLIDIIEEKRTVIECAPLPSIRGVFLQLQQVFANILGNSIKYSKAGEPAVIKVTVELVAAEKIEGTPDSPAKYFHKISFMDNGIGFEQQYAGKIFELFQRLHGKKEYPGTGIGLAICKKIVQNHGGMIDASGELGKGASFHIYLPQA